MVLTASQCDAPHIMPDYAADLSVPILDRGRNAKEREIGSSTILLYIIIILISVFTCNKLD